METFNLLDLFKLIFTKENITLFIAIIGAAGTIINALMQRKKLHLDVLKIKNVDHGFYLHIQISNKSKLPISITSLTLHENGISIPCCVDRQVYERIVDIRKMDKHDLYTAEFPISLSPLDACSEWVCFPIPTNDALFSPKRLRLSIETTRGKIRIMSLQLAGVPHIQNRTQ